MRVADYIITRLYESGVDSIFSVSGRGALFLTDAVAKHKKIKNIATHHEQSAAFAAFAYAQKSGKIGACLVSTGCASTNAITGLLCAWQDNIPCIFISGQNTLNETSNFTGLNIRTYGQQEADIIPIVKSITKYSVMLHKADEIYLELEKALYYANEGRKGPVWIDIPLDIQSAMLSNIEKNYHPKIDFLTETLFNESDNYCSRLVENIRNAKRPIVLIGSGVKSSNAEIELKKFIERFEIPLVYSNSAPDTYGSKNTFSIGSIGSMGASRAGNFALQNSDLVIVLGNRLSSYSTGVDYCKFARNAKIIVVDIDPIEHKKNSIKINDFIFCDIKILLKKLNNFEFSLDIDKWRNKCIHWKNIFSQLETEFTNSEKIDLYELTECLSNNLPSSSTLVTDSGFIEVILPNNFKFGNGQNIIHPISQGSMGFALPACVGSYFSSNDPIFVVVGDGSIMMNLQELQTIKHYNVPAKIIVINNNVYGIIRRRQNDLFRNRTIGTDSSNGVSVPNFEKIANAFEIGFQKIEKKEDLYEGINKLINSNGPVLCEIICRTDQSYIEVGYARDKNGKFVRRPLEDQIPFLNREVFLNEMLIEPIDQ